MKGLIRKAVLALGCAAGAALGGPALAGGDWHDSHDGSGGIGWYRYLVDPCYPERYEYLARQAVNASLAPQVHNGHVLDQTVWEYHFEPGTACLTPGGLEHLAYLARRRPCPDTTVFLQTAQCVAWDPCHPEGMVRARQELDEKRTQAVQSFLTAVTAGRGGLCFQVVVHDPAEVGLGAIPVNNSVQQMYLRFRGGLLGGGGTAGGGGGAGGAR